MSTVNEPTGWVGWIGFAGIILILNGVFSAVQGFMALLGSNTYYLVSSGTLFLFDVTGWGWWNIIIGALLVLTGIALFGGATWARIIAVILAALSAVGQMLLLPAQPWWAFIVIAIDVLVIYAVTAHGREVKAA
ncbi:hypothetical protein EV379_1865 [Microterricola gilva]|uniref:DUF7144 domain-containing protein n=1 Tax=Microterricola gilva TaxID=393267 RepID=A0A4Q8AN25_9MICO|nr:hypothetical protein [Microterricola gilva]RZU65531.1 hypothetical protein EV379_1865 [Microterricola gilva]